MGEVSREYLRMDQVEGGYTGAAYLSSELLNALKKLETPRTGEVSREYLWMDQVEGGVHRSCLPEQ
jgi:hypothetical protein